MQQLQNTSRLSSDPQGRPGDGEQADLSREGDKKATDTTTPTRASSQSSYLSKGNSDSVKYFPVPPQHRNCNLDGKKDALSAISRASSRECKDLLHNVTCLQMAGLLYDVNIRRQCLVKDPGRNFGSKPLLSVTGGMRVVFLLSLHGRAFRQVKRLFKTLYHKDHYYFIHVDSVSYHTCTCSTV